MSPWIAAVGSVLLVSLVSLVGLVTLSWRAVRLERMVFLLVALAVGAMLDGRLWTRSPAKAGPEPVESAA